MKGFSINLGIFVVALTALSVSLEVGLGLMKINTKANVRFLHNMGTTHIPGAYYRHTKEGFSEGYFNSHGFRDRERSYEKPANTYRILIMGDSQVEALQVSLTNSFPALLEQALNDRALSQRFEVLSLGQAGFGTAEEYMRYMNFGVKYSPDLVLVLFTTTNDFQDNSKVLSWQLPRFYFTFDQNKNLVLDSSTLDAYEKDYTLLKRLFQRFKQHSYLASLISERLFLLRTDLQKTQLEAHAPAIEGMNDGAKVPEFSGLNIFLHDRSPRWEEAFDITKGILLKFRSSVEERGARFILVTNPGAEQVYPEMAEQLNRQYGRVFDYEQPNRILGEFAKKEAITLFELMPVFQSHHSETGAYLHGFGSSRGGHWNERGHRLAAAEIMKFLIDKHLVPL